MSTKLKLQQSSKQTQVPYGLLGVDREQWSSNVDSYERQKYDTVLESVLAELEPVCLSEQQFCVSFFQLDIISPSSKNTQTTLDQEFAETSHDVGDGKLSSSNLIPRKTIDRQINEDVRKMMGELFMCLEPELVSFLSCYEKNDSL